MRYFTYTWFLYILWQFSSFIAECLTEKISTGCSLLCCVAWCQRRVELPCWGYYTKIKIYILLTNIPILLQSNCLREDPNTEECICLLQQQSFTAPPYHPFRSGTSMIMGTGHFYGVGKLPDQFVLRTGRCAEVTQYWCYISQVSCMVCGGCLNGD